MKIKKKKKNDPLFSGLRNQVGEGAVYRDGRVEEKGDHGEIKSSILDRTCGVPNSQI